MRTLGISEGSFYNLSFLFYNCSSFSEALVEGRNDTLRYQSEYEMSRKKNADLAAVSSGLTELKTWRKMWEEIISQSSPGSFQDIIVDAYDRMSCMHLTFRLISRTVY